MAKNQQLVDESTSLQNIFLDNPYTEDRISDINYQENFINAIKYRIENNKLKSRPNDHSGFVDTEEEYENDTVQLSITDYLPSKYLSYKSYHTKTQKWLGHIISIHKDGFTAELKDLTLNGTKEVADFDLGDVSDADKDLMKIGAAFYWCVGKEVRNGQVINQSFIRFQRLPNLGEHQINRALDASSDLFNELTWD